MNLYDLLDKAYVVEPYNITVLARILKLIFQFLCHFSFYGGTL